MDRKEQLVEQRKKFFEMQHKMAQQMPRTAVFIINEGKLRP